MAAEKWEVKLNNGNTIPAFGLGTWLSKPGEVGAAVEAALRAGYRHIDCAHVYGNEAEVGVAMQKCFKEGVVKREDVFITSKLWNTEHAREDVVPACQLTLKNLQLDYLDLYLIHWPQCLRKGAKLTPERFFPDEDLLGYDPDRAAKCWEGMEEVAAKGLSKAIGISNFTITKTEKLLETAKIVPAVNQVECHPYFQQQKLKEYLDGKGIVLEAYSPLGNPGRPEVGATDPVVLEDAVVKEIATKHGATVAQLCISFTLHRGLVVIPKSVKQARITENLKSTELKLDQEDMRRLRGVDKNIRLMLGQIFYGNVVTKAIYWDEEADEKFEVKQPESKKQRQEE